MIIRIFAVALILIGGFLAYGIIGSLSRIFQGEKTVALVVGLDRIENKYKKFDKPSYTTYPILRFNYKNRTVQLTDKNNSGTEKEINNKINIYYSEKYGISRGFTAFQLVLSIISLTFLFFGIVILLKQK
ncbi:hypothetical protein [Epilithonimonas lactis]|uniref:DUF3592 domain-containing protein n=1 Tax=Epilithonimonas lactis TaxID=421072 RepID=A0A085B7H8_9FLAO|nr:hypothetical protein [Epilithonimonas lactis]KFC18423.1 hypothetical protein IO89_18195 [Epilithonimonas lactis]SER01672.1 hypothetical protein SAMN04488097_3663 [Epilithonimonas lactis]